MKYKIGTILQDEDGYIGIVGIRYNDGDFCTIENDAAHPNPKKCDKDAITKFAGDGCFREMIKDAKAQIAKGGRGCFRDKRKV